MTSLTWIDSESHFLYAVTRVPAPDTEQKYILFMVAGTTIESPLQDTLCYNRK